LRPGGTRSSNHVLNGHQHINTRDCESLADIDIPVDFYGSLEQASGGSNAVDGSAAIVACSQNTAPK
jgi:hypothetical protein